MTSVGARRAGVADTHTRADSDRGRTPAQWYGYIIGAVLLLAGLVGMLEDHSFDTESSSELPLNGNKLVGLEVNGWHNLVHIGSGLLLILLATKRASAKTAALAFGVVYLVVAAIGFIDGNDVLGFMPVNTADNFLHLGLGLAGLVAGLVSRADDRPRAAREDIG